MASAIMIIAAKAVKRKPYILKAQPWPAAVEMDGPACYTVGIALNAFIRAEEQILRDIAAIPPALKRSC